MVDCIISQEHILLNIFWDLKSQDILAFITASRYVSELCFESNGIRKCILAKITDEWVHNYGWLERAFVMSVYSAHFKVFCELLNRGVDPSTHNNEAIVSACAQGLDKFVGVLLERSQVNPSARSNLPLLLAIQSQKVGLVRQLLNDSRVNPNDRHGACFKVLAQIGNLEMMGVFSGLMSMSTCKNESV